MDPAGYAVGADDWAALHFGPECLRRGLGVRQLDALALAIGPAAGVPIVIGIDLAVLLANLGLLHAFRQRHA